MNVTISIMQCLCKCNCCFEKDTKNYIITNETSDIFLFNGYTINVIKEAFNYIVLKIYNKNRIYYKIAYSSYPFEALFLNEDCSTLKVVITYASNK